MGVAVDTTAAYRSGRLSCCSKCSGVKARAFSVVAFGGKQPFSLPRAHSLINADDSLTSSAHSG
jgi:hypothetical protein